MNTNFPLARQSRRIGAAALACALGLACLPAHADSISGDCRQEKDTIRFVDGVVYKESNVFDAKKIDTLVVLASFPLDKAAIAATTQKSAAITSQRFAAERSHTLKLRLDGERVSALDYGSPGGSMSQSGTGVGELKIVLNDANQIDARFTLEGDADDLQCALSFKLAYAGSTAASVQPADKTAAAAGGKPLPPGGGEAGKVFQANLAAMQKGDIDGMLATVSKAQADKMRAQQSDPKFGAMLKLMKSFAPKSATVTGGQDFGDRAELTIDAVGQSGAKSQGTSKLVKEDGQWKVEKTSMKSGG